MKGYLGDQENAELTLWEQLKQIFNAFEKIPFILKESFIYRNYPQLLGIWTSIPLTGASQMISAVTCHVWETVRFDTICNFKRMQHFSGSQWQLLSMISFPINMKTPQEAAKRNLLSFKTFYINPLLSSVPLLSVSSLKESAKVDKVRAYPSGKQRSLE